MIIGIGVDTVGIARFEEKITKKPGLARMLFTEAELELKPRSLAARFAAKEALIKALGGSHSLRWHDMEVPNAKSSRPEFTKTERLSELLAELNVTDLHLSMTHDADTATAFVVAESL